MDKDIIVEIVNEDRIGCNHQLSDMIVHELLKLGFERVLLDLIEKDGNGLFVEFFVADFDLVDDVEEKILFGVVKNVS